MATVRVGQTAKGRIAEGVHPVRALGRAVTAIINRFNDATSPEAGTERYRKAGMGTREEGSVRGGPLGGGTRDSGGRLG